MKTCWFIVICSRDTWWVDCEGKSYGPFPSPVEAQQEAKKLAEVFGDPSRRCLVLTPNVDGHQELVWATADPGDTV